MQLFLFINASTIITTSIMTMEKWGKNEENSLAHPYQLHHNFNIFSPKHVSMYHLNPY